MAFIIEGWIPSHQRTARQNRWKTTGWSHTHTMARWTLCHMGCHIHRHRCGIILKPHILLRWLSSWSSSCHTEGGKIFRNRQQQSFIPLAFETFGPINQAGCDFLSSLGHRLTLVWDDPRVSSFHFQRISISIQRFKSVCLCNSCGNLPHNFLTNRDAPGVSSFPLIFNALRNEVPRATEKNNKK